jgi:chromosomal replication initiation ATPase DnaA
MNRVCEEFNITPNILFKKSKAVQFVRPRQIFFYFCKKYTNYTLDRIGSLGQYHEVGSQSPATVKNAISAVNDIYPIDLYFNKIQRLDEIIQKNLQCN